MYHLSEAYLMASYISLLAIYLGALIFGTAAVAPIAVGTLAEDSAGIFLRRYWVVYHRFAVFGGLPKRAWVHAEPLGLLLQHLHDF